jgi:hypothetical protein
MKKERAEKLNFDKITISDFEMSKVIGGTLLTSVNNVHGNDEGGPPDGLQR